MNDAVTGPLLSPEQAWQLQTGAITDPFAVLGPVEAPTGRYVRAFLPGATGVDVLSRATRAPLGQLSASLPDGYFVGRVSSDEPYLLQIHWPGADQETEDPYTFGLLLSDTDLHLFNEGRHFGLADTFGAKPADVEGVKGVRFAVWAPNARRVAVVGDFNAWDNRRHGMRLRYPAGVWELFIPRLQAGAR